MSYFFLLSSFFIVGAGEGKGAGDLVGG